MISRDARVNLLIGTGHFLSHFYQLSLPPLFFVWSREFDISFAELGLAVTLMAGAAAVLQTPVGFLVDRYGARRFLIGGALLTSLAIAAMAAATSFWQIVVLAVLSGIGNSVFHPCDYAILAGSIGRERLGRAFSLHSFTGNIGFALAPPIVVALMAVMGWRETLLLVGLLGVPVAAAIVWQSSILREEVPHKKKERGLTARELLFERTMLLFFGFYFLSATASAGVQAWLITILLTLKGFELAAASAALTGYMIGNSAGVLAGGWLADAGKQRLPTYIVTLTVLSAALTLGIGLLPVGPVVVIAMAFVSGTALGASRTPRDIMLKDAAPPGQIGKVFGFVSAGAPLGSAVTPAPFGFLIDHGLPQMVLILSAGLLLASLLCMGTARASARRQAVALAE